MPYKDKRKNRDYMKAYMVDYRKMQREAIRRARAMGFDTRVKRTQKKRKTKVKRRKK